MTLQGSGAGGGSTGAGGGSTDAGGGSTDAGGGSTGAGGGSAEFGKDEVSSLPQPAKPSTTNSTRNIPDHRDVNSLGKQQFFVLFKIGRPPCQLEEAT